MIQEKNKEPFVRACNDFLNGELNAKVLINSNKADVEEVELSYFFRPYSKMPILEKHALSLCKGKVLDIGAGVGSHSLYLQENNIDVTALEIKPGLVDIISRRGVRNVICEDIFNYSGGKFDILLMLMNGIGLVSDFQGLEIFLKRAKKILKKGGSIILDSSDLIYLYQEEDGSYLIDLNSDYYGIVEYNFEYKDVKSESFKWLYIDYSQLKFYAEQVGFRCDLLLEVDYNNYLARIY
ncbi:MAG: SAM-dependent methyltransferase [Marinilabiliales bacterium]|nr:MAG: SAM-dependent methyltransferase [Marinilabiliales bacterium]